MRTGPHTSCAAGRLGGSDAIKVACFFKRDAKKWMFLWKFENRRYGTLISVNAGSKKAKALRARLEAYLNGRGRIPLDFVESPGVKKWLKDAGKFLGRSETVEEGARKKRDLDEMYDPWWLAKREKVGCDLFEQIGVEIRNSLWKFDLEGVTIMDDDIYNVLSLVALGYDRESAINDVLGEIREVLRK